MINKNILLYTEAEDLKCKDDEVYILIKTLKRVSKIFLNKSHDITIMD